MGPIPPPLNQPRSLFPVRPEIAAYGRAAALAETDETLRTQRDYYKELWLAAEGRACVAVLRIAELHEQLAILRSRAA